VEDWPLADNFLQKLQKQRGPAKVLLEKMCGFNSISRRGTPPFSLISGTNQPREDQSRGPTTGPSAETSTTT